MPKAKRSQSGKLKIKEIYYRNYRCTLCIVYHDSLSIDEIYNELAKDCNDLEEQFSNEEDVTSAAMTIGPTNERTIYVLFNNDCTLSEITHEAIHVTSIIFYLIQTEHNKYTEEVYAYLHMMIFEHITEYLNPLFKKGITIQ